MLRKLIILSFIAGAIGLASESDKCPVIKQRLWNLDRVIAGKWYEYKRSSNNWAGADKCTGFQYKRIGSGEFSVICDGISTIDNGVVRTVGKLTYKDPRNLTVTYFVPVVGVVKESYVILETDYDNYAISWSCVQQGSRHISYYWYITREPQPCMDIDRIAQRVIQEYGLQPESMSKVDQDNCPYN
ncbi:apolipoprotein D-like [Microplitis mediator]|uniref:apolipoprotein D-like n=1 Tax=Microplitis mediator TaxID=375433 RepID=UPI0025535C37|nr:apolipoprotein D-like [Microplitis mediator]